MKVGDSVRLPRRYHGNTCWGHVRAIFDTPGGPVAALEWSYGRRHFSGKATVAEIEAEAVAFAEHRRENARRLRANRRPAPAESRP